MTVQEKAIESALKKLDDQRINFGILDRFDVDENHAVTQALEEIKLYRALGTVGELKEAREKQIPKKVIYKPQDAIYQRPYCPTCGKELFDNNYSVGYCECGQALKWGEEDD